MTGEETANYYYNSRVCVLSALLSSSIYSHCHELPGEPQGRVSISCFMSPLDMEAPHANYKTEFCFEASPLGPRIPIIQSSNRRIDTFSSPRTRAVHNTHPHSK